MAGNTNTIQIELTVDDKGTVKITRFGNELARTEARGKQAAGGLKRGFEQMAGALDTAYHRLTSVYGQMAALAGGYGAMRLARSFLDAARTTENFQVRLGILLGSVDEGARLFKEMERYASQVPFQYQEIMAAATTLAGVLKGGVDDIRGWMPLIGDLAAASGLGIQETTEQFIRMYSAGAAAADRFRERGILAMLGFESGVAYSAEETRRKLLDAWTRADSQFRGATDKMKNTWDGAVSMILDKWNLFRNQVMAAGVYSELKTVLDEINSRFQTWLDINEDIIRQRVPEYIESVKTALDRVWSIVSYDPAIFEWGLVGLLLGGRKGAVALAALAHMVEVVKTQAAGLALASQGYIRWIDLITANYQDLKKLVDDFDRFAASQGPRPSPRPGPKPSPSPSPTLGGGGGGRDAAKQARDREQMQRDLTEKINSMVLDEYNYKRWALEQEWADLQQSEAYQKASADERRAIEDQVIQYKLLSLDQISAAEKTAAAKLAGDREQIQRDISEKIKSIILDEYDCKRWALEQEWTDIEAGAAYQQASADERRAIEERFIQYKLLALDQISAAEKTAAEERARAAEEAAQRAIDAEERRFRESRRWQDGAVRALQDYADAAADAGAQTENFMLGALNSLEDALVDFVTTGKFEFKDFANSVIADLARIFIQQQFTGPLAKWMAGASIFHGGGIVGRDAGPARQVPAWLFTYAPRLHAGLQSDEFPAILQRGEEVRSRADVAAGQKDAGRMTGLLEGILDAVQSSQGLRIVNVEAQSAQDFLTSSAGERTVVNIMRRNRAALRR